MKRNPLIVTQFFPSVEFTSTNINKLLHRTLKEYQHYLDVLTDDPNIYSIMTRLCYLQYFLDQKSKYIASFSSFKQFKNYDENYYPIVKELEKILCLLITKCKNYWKP